MSQPLFTLETSPPSWSRTSVYLFIFVYFLVLLILIIFFSFCVLLQRWDLTVRIKIKGILNNIPLWLTLPGHYCGNPKACTKTWTLDDGRWTVDDGRWTMDDGRWTMDDGRWRSTMFLSRNIVRQCGHARFAREGFSATTVSVTQYLNILSVGCVTQRRI